MLKEKNRVELSFKQIKAIGESERVSTEIVTAIIDWFNGKITVEGAMDVFRDDAIIHENWDKVVAFYNENFEGSYDLIDLQTSNDFVELSNGCVLEID